MIESLELIDREILLFINGLHTDWLDPIMWAISSNWFWLPMVALFIFMAVKRFGKWCWIPILAATLCFATTDVVSHNVKESVQRYRPTHNLEIEDEVHTVNDYRGGMYGFFSGHAANSFGLALITMLFIRRKWYTITALCWAAIVSYSRMYLAVHYPADIFVGFCFGISVAVAFFIATKAIVKKSKKLKTNLSL